MEAFLEDDEDRPRPPLDLLCSGALIQSQWVLTAAECIVDVSNCQRKKPPECAPDCPHFLYLAYGGLFNNSRPTEDEVTRRMVEVHKT